MKHRILIIEMIILTIYVFSGCSTETKVKSEESSVSGGMSTVQFHTLGTVLEVKDNDSVVIRVHGEEEDANYLYKDALNYLDEEQIEFYWTNTDGCLKDMEAGDVIAISYFADQKDERPLLVYSGDWIGKEYNGINIMLYESAFYTKEEVMSAAQTIIDHFENEFPGCRMLDLRYEESGYKKEAAEWAMQYETNEVIILVSDFETDEVGGDGSLNPNSTYEDWKWILVRLNDEWELKTWGY